MTIVSFDDFEAYESAYQSWNIRTRKLEGGLFRGQMLQLAVGPVRVAYTRHSSALEITGTAPSGFQSFGMPIPRGLSGFWCNKPTSEQTVSVFDASYSFEAVTRPGFETVVFSISEERIGQLGETLGFGAPRDILSERGVVTCNPSSMRELRRALLQIVRTVTCDGSIEEQAALREELEGDIPSRLLGALADQNPQPQPVASHLRHRALRRALEHIAALPNEPLGIEDLCRATGASERTLRRAFTECLGVPPNPYLRARRLNGVYRELRSGAAQGLLVSEIAHRWGFWHMGQFAADYRRLFGELPSATLARSHGRGGARILSSVAAESNR